MDAYIYMMLNGINFFATSPGDTGELERRMYVNSPSYGKTNLCLCCQRKKAKWELKIYCSEKCRKRYHEIKGWKYYKKGGTRIMNNWVRKIVKNWFHTITVGLETTMLLPTNRQNKFLHLQRQCYWDCVHCEREAENE